jgi:hypothetical protein
MGPYPSLNAWQGLVMRSLGAVAVSIVVAIALLGTAVAPVSAQPGSAPGHIVLQAKIGGKQVEAVLRRVQGSDWQWLEGNAAFNFKAVSESSTQLVIHDASRDMYHLLELPTRQTFWRTGTTGPWNNHYTIVQTAQPQSVELD